MQESAIHSRALQDTLWPSIATCAEKYNQLGEDDKRWKSTSSNRSSERIQRMDNLEQAHNNDAT